MRNRQGHTAEGGVGRRGEAGGGKEGEGREEAGEHAVQWARENKSASVQTLP